MFFHSDKYHASYRNWRLLSWKLFPVTFWNNVHWRTIQISTNFASYSARALKRLKFCTHEKCGVSRATIWRHPWASLALSRFFMLHYSKLFFELSRLVTFQHTKRLTEDKNLSSKKLLFMMDKISSHTYFETDEILARSNYWLLQSIRNCSESFFTTC